MSKNADNSSSPWNSEDALKKLEQVRQHCPATIYNKIEFYLQTAHGKSSAGDYIGALGEYNQAVSLDINNCEIYAQRAAIKHKLKDYWGALRDYNLCLAINPKHAEALNQRSIIKYMLGDYNSAFEDSEQSESIKQREGEYFQKLLASEQ